MGEETQAVEVPESRDVSILAGDGTKLAASLFSPVEGSVAATVVIAPATGVRRRYYAAYARFLARHGFLTLTFDYRGIGDSRPTGTRGLRGFRAAMHEWGELDLSTALGFLSTQAPHVPALLVGHSAGGQLVGRAAFATPLSGMVFVSSQSGYWKCWSGRGRLRMAALWYLAIPALATVLGYLPMRRLLGGEDLPAGVALEWARWGRHPRYILSHSGRLPDGAPGFDGLTCPLAAFAFTDDDFAPVAAVEALVGFYSGTRSFLRVVRPADVGAREIGHFGFFREAFQETLWRESLSCLSEFRDAGSGALVREPGGKSR